jgi:hypothetical protein
MYQSDNIKNKFRLKIFLLLKKNTDQFLETKNELIKKNVLRRINKLLDCIYLFIKSKRISLS